MRSLSLSDQAPLNLSMDSTGTSSSSSSSSSSLPRLHLHHLPLIGRTQERRILQDAFRRLNKRRAPHTTTDKDNNTKQTKWRVDEDDDGGGCHFHCYNEVVMIQGASGSGKSLLVEDFIHPKEAQSDQTTFFACSGKFNQQQMAVEPYSALKQAFAEICDSIIHISNSEDRAVMCRALKEALGDEIGILADGIVPSIMPLIMTTLSNEEQNQVHLKGNGNQEAQGGADALNQLRHLVQLFIRAVCEHRRLVLFLDDLQWADEATLGLLESLLKDVEMPQFLMIGAYRNDEEDFPKDHHLRSLLRGVKSVRNIDELTLGPLTVEEIGELIRHATRLDEQPAEAIRSFSEVVFSKTRGNPFVVVEFLQLLEAKHHLFYSLIEFRWKFDLTKIEQETFLADSIVQVVASRIKSLPLSTQYALKIASCLYTRFHLNSLFCILERLHRLSQSGDDVVGTISLQTKDDLRKALKTAVSESLLDKIQKGGTEFYKFSHDKIQQSAYSLLPPEGEDRNQFHISLGKIVESLSKDEQERAANPTFAQLIFIATDQYNRGYQSLMDDKDLRLHVAELNLLSTEKAISQSAFAAAWKYVQCGIRLLDINCWTANYNLALHLHIYGAEVASCLGLLEDVDVLVNQVLENVQSFDERLSVQMSRVEALASQNKVKESMQLSQTLLILLGESIPKKAHMGHVLFALGRTKGLMKQFTDADVLSLPSMTDSRKAHAMRLLQRYSTSALFRQRTSDMLLAMMKLVQISLKHGLHKISPSALGSYAIVLASLGDVDGAYRLGKLGLKLFDGVIKAKEWEGNFIQLYSPFVQHWREAYPDCMDQCSRGYCSGMASGDLEFAFYNAICYCAFYYMAGLHLVPIEKDCRSYCLQMVQYKKENNFAVSGPLWQLLLNLMGHAKDPLLLTGAAMDEKEFVSKHVEANNIGGLQTFWVYKGQALFFFGNPEEAEQVFIKFARTSSNIASHFFVVMQAFYYALVVLELSRKTKKRKYKVASRKMIRKIRNWVSKGNINLSHKLMLLEADYMALTEKREDVLRRAFDRAIRAASRAGFLSDAAIANERAGIHFRERKDGFWAETYLSRSAMLFSEWGAQGKVNFMYKMYPEFLRSNEDMSFGAQADSTASSVGGSNDSSRGRGHLQQPPKSTSYRAKQKFDPECDKMLRTEKSGGSSDFMLPSMDLIEE